MTTIQPAYGWADLDAANAQHYARKYNPRADYHQRLERLQTSAVDGFESSCGVYDWLALGNDLLDAARFALNGDWNGVIARCRLAADRAADLSPEICADIDAIIAELEPEPDDAPVSNADMKAGW